MSRKRTPISQLALGLDGGVLINAARDLDSRLVSRLARSLAVRSDELFIGTRLPEAQLATAMARLENAAAEVAARIQGSAAAQSFNRGKSHGGLKKV